MDSHEKEAVGTRRRRNAVEVEQTLCNEVLKSTDFDQLSDEAWISLCEDAATKGRKSGQPPDES